MTSPLELARSLAEASDHKSHVLAVAMVARGLSDDEPTTFRQGWPLADSIVAAIGYLDLEKTDRLIADAAALAPTLSDAVLNRRDA